jgi:IclR family transcriptional regulator, KDG regulon repressor
MAKDYTVPAVQRTVQVLEILAGSHQGISLADLSRQTRIPKSSLFRILLTLEQYSIVTQDHDRSQYSLGMKLIDWGNRALEKIDLKTVSHPHLIRMSHETHESYYVAVLDQEDVIIIDRADTPEIWRMVARLGQRSPLHCTATGQVMIAELGDEAIDDIIKRHGLKKFTPATITGATRFKKRLAEVRAQGYSVADAEYKTDLCAIAVPIRDHHGRVCASLMTAMHSDRARRNKQQVSQLVSILKRESEVISRDIGFMDVEAAAKISGNGGGPV